MFEFDDHIVHWVAMSRLLDGHTRDCSFLSNSAFLAQKGSEIVGDDRIFESETRTAR